MGDDSKFNLLLISVQSTLYFPKNRHSPLIDQII